MISRICTWKFLTLVFVMGMSGSSDAIAGRVATGPYVKILQQGAQGYMGHANKEVQPLRSQISCWTSLSAPGDSQPTLKVSCFAKDRYGTIRQCSTTDPSLVKSLDSMTAFSFIRFYHGAKGTPKSGECTYIMVATHSTHIPDIGLEPHNISTGGTNVSLLGSSGMKAAWGSMAATRFSSTNNDHIGCLVQNGRYLVCSARDADGDYASCWSNSATDLAMVKTMTAYSHIYFHVGGNPRLGSRCRALTIRSNNIFVPQEQP